MLAANFRRELVAKVETEARRVRARATINIDVDRNQFTRSLSSIGGLIGRFGSQAASMASKGLAPLNSVMSSVSGAFSAGTSSISGVIFLLLKMATIAPLIAAGLAVVGGSAIAAFGAISAAALGLPVVLFSIGAPIAAIMLGMDGITRAAGVLKEEFKSLKTSVSVAFEYGMRPVFEKLKAIFPTLNVGLSQVAYGVSRVASDFAGILTTPAGIEHVRVALGGVSTAIDYMRPGLASLFRELLHVAGTRELYQIFGDTVGGIAHRFAGLIDQVRSTGDLTGALEQLQNVLFGITDLLSLLVEGSIKFFRSAGPGLTKFFGSITEVLSRVDWAALGESFGGLMERIGAAIQRVPPETWQKLSDAIGKLIATFLSWAEGGGIDNMLKGLALLANVLAFVSGIVLTLHSSFIGFITGIPRALGGIPSALGGFASAVGSSLKGIPGAFDESLGGLPGKAATAVEDVNVGVVESFAQLPSNLSAAFGDIAGYIGGFFAGIGTWIGNAFTGAKDAVFTAVTNFVAGILTAFQALPAQIEAFLVILPDRIGYYLGYAATIAYLEMKELVETIIMFFAQLPGYVIATLSDMVTQVGQWLESLRVMATEIAFQTVAAIINWFVGLPAQIGALLQQLVEGAIGLLTWLWQQAGILSGQIITAIVTWFSNLPGQVVAFVVAMVNGVIQFFQNLPSQLANIAGQAVTAVVNAFGTLPARVLAWIAKMVDDILGYLADLPGRMYQKGQEVIQGFIDGLKSAGSRVFGVITSIIGGAERGANDALESRSPSLVFRRIGHSTVQGYILGIRDKLAPALAQIREVFAQVVAAATERFAATTGAGFAGTTAMGGALGSATTAGVDIPQLISALAQVFDAAEWRLDGSDLTLATNRGNLQLARR